MRLGFTEARGDTCWASKLLLSRLTYGAKLKEVSSIGSLLEVRVMALLDFVNRSELSFRIASARCLTSAAEASMRD